MVHFVSLWCFRLSIKDDIDLLHHSCLQVFLAPFRGRNVSESINETGNLIFMIMRTSRDLKFYCFATYSNLFCLEVHIMSFYCCFSDASF